MSDLRERALEIAKAPHAYAGQDVSALINELLTAIITANEALVRAKSYIVKGTWDRSGPVARQIGEAIKRTE